MRYVIGIGSNMGDSVSIVRRAIDEIEATFDIDVDERSSLYRTRPVGGPEQDDYINAVVVMHCDRDPDRVLAGLQEIEHEFGRVRDVRWGPRTLDLDIIAVDDMISVDPDLTLPHPRAHERAFVLVPWHEIDPEATLPHHGPIENLLDRLTHGAEDGSRIPSASSVVVVAGGDQAPGTST